MGQIISEDAINKHGDEIVNKNGIMVKEIFHTKTLRCKSLNGALLKITVEDFYHRIKRDHKNTWNLIEEINKKKLVWNPVMINKNMLF